VPGDLPPAIFLPWSNSSQFQAGALPDLLSRHSLILGSSIRPICHQTLPSPATFKLSRLKPLRLLLARSRHLSSHPHTWPNVCIRATARRPGTTEMGAEPSAPSYAECLVSRSLSGSARGLLGEGFRMPSGVRKPPKHEPAGLRRRSMGIWCFARLGWLCDRLGSAAGGGLVSEICRPADSRSGICCG
jgi:hypothetical protein